MELLDQRFGPVVKPRIHCGLLASQRPVCVYFNGLLLILRIFAYFGRQISVMDSHSHDQYHSETKPVAFTIPFILALVTVIVMGLFLSLCDPQPHHESHGTVIENKAHSNHSDHRASPNQEGGAPPAKPSAPAEGAQHN